MVYKALRKPSSITTATAAIDNICTRRKFNQKNKRMASQEAYLIVEFLVDSTVEIISSLWIYGKEVRLLNALMSTLIILLYENFGENYAKLFGQKVFLGRSFRWKSSEAFIHSSLCLICLVGLDTSS